MRNVIVAMQVTLDGFVAGPNGELDWLVEHAISDEAWESSNALFSTVDTVLLGRVNYEGYSYFWPPMETNPASTPNDVAFARWLNNVPKVVFSRTLDKAAWQNSRLVQDHIGAEVLKLKQQPGQNILIMNSASIVHALMAEDLIDEYRLNIHPVVLGGGKSLFGPSEKRHKLKLMHHKLAKSGVMEMHYQTVRA